MDFVDCLLHGIQAALDFQRLPAQSDMQKYIIVVALLGTPALQTDSEAAP